MALKFAGYRGASLTRKHPTPRTLQQDYAQGPMVVLLGGAFSYERGTHVCPNGIAYSRAYE